MVLSSMQGESRLLRGWRPKKLLTYGSFVQIVNEILTKRYVRKSASRIRSADLHHIGNLLDDWWRELPVCLKLDPMNLPEWCPPIHIFSLK